MPRSGGLHLGDQREDRIWTFQNQKACSDCFQGSQRSNFQHHEGHLHGQIYLQQGLWQPWAVCFVLESEVLEDLVIPRGHTQTKSCSRCWLSRSMAAPQKKGLGMSTRRPSIRPPRKKSPQCFCRNTSLAHGAEPSATIFLSSIRARWIRRTRR